jgi:serine/threonine protein kinase
MAVQIVLGVAEALEAAHDARDAQGQPLELVHRDVSPQNVIVTGHGSIKLIDFGIARARQRRERTETGFIKGKYAYMSPEQIRAEPVDRQSDLFSLGLLLYELTTMKRPHGETAGPAMAYVRSEIDCPDPRSVCEGYSEELAGIVNRLLNRDRSQRFKTAREVHEALRLFSATEGLSLSPFTLREWVEGIDAPLARGSGSWMGQDADVRAPSLNEQTPRALTNQPTSVIRGLALAVTTRAATQYDFEVLEEQEAVDDEAEATPVAEETTGRGLRIAGLISASFVLGLCVLVAILATQGRLEATVGSALELLAL